MKTRGPQVTFIGKRRQGKIIRAVAERGTWKGRRGRARLMIGKSEQLNIEGSIAFTATLFYERVNGAAGTVVEAIEKLEDWYRERTRQHDPRQNRASNSGRRDPGRRPGKSRQPLDRTTETKKRTRRAKARGRKADQ